LKEIKNFLNSNNINKLQASYNQLKSSIDQLLRITDDFEKFLYKIAETEDGLSASEAEDDVRTIMKDIVNGINFIMNIYTGLYNLESNINPLVTKEGVRLTSELNKAMA